MLVVPIPAGSFEGVSGPHHMAGTGRGAGVWVPSSIVGTLAALPSTPSSALPTRALKSAATDHSAVWPTVLRRSGAILGLLAAKRACSVWRRLRGHRKGVCLITQTAPVGVRLEGDSESDEICELTGWELEGQDFFRLLQQPMRKTQRRRAWQRSFFFSARSGLEHPEALWIIGPSAAGKSTIARCKAKELGLDQNGWVLIDGEKFREEHPGFGAAKRDGHAKGCVWWAAYSELKDVFNMEKDHLMNVSKKARKNLVIPHTCLHLASCLQSIRELKAHGYICHVVGIYGERSTLMQRGKRRALEQGKRYEPREFDQSMEALEPMMGESNGMRQLIVTGLRGARASHAGLVEN